MNPLNFGNTAPEFLEFEIAQFQPDSATFSSEEDMVEKFRTGRLYDMEKLLVRARPNSWNSLTYTSGVAPTNWTGAFVAPNTNQRVKISLEQKEIYQTEVKVSFSTDSGATFIEEQLLLKTGDQISGQPKFEFVTKPRFFPLHPTFSAYPPQLRGASTTDFGLGIRGIFTEYDEKPRARQGRFYKTYKSNYEKNLDFLTSGATQPSFTAFPTTIVDQHRPQIMIKTSNRNLDIVANGTAYPMAVDKIRQQEVPPENRATLGNLLNLSSAYSAESSFTSPVSFAGAGAATTIPFIPSIAVEINNLPLSGYISKEFNVREQRIGVGSKLPIVGVIPSLEQATSTEPQIFFRYNAPYSQPVICKLPTETFLYNLSFRLREVSTGKIVEGLNHPTELIFRINPLPDEEKDIPQMRLENTIPIM